MLARRIALNSLVSAAVRVAGTVISLATIGFVTRYFSRAEWGEFSIILAFGGIFAVLADLGLYQMMVREISREGASENKIINNIFTLRLFSSLFIFALAPIASLFLPYSDLTRLGIALGMVGFWFLTDVQVLVGIFQKYLRMDKVALAEFSGKIVQFLAVIWFIKEGFGFLWIVLTVVLGGLINFLIVWYLLAGHAKLRLDFDFPFWKEIWRKSRSLAMANILTMIYFSANAIILSVFWPPEDVGIFRLSYKVLEGLIFFPTMFVGLIMPLLSRYALPDFKMFKKTFQRTFDILMIFGWPLVFGGIIVSPQIIQLLGGSQYQESVMILKILMAAVGFIFLGTLFSFGLIALGKQKILLKISAAGMAVNLILNLIFIPKYSFLAAAWVTVLTEGLVLGLMFWVFWRFWRLWPSFRSALKSFLAALIMSLFLWYFHEKNLLFLVSLGGMIYFLTLWLFKGFSLKDLGELLRGKESA